MAWGGPCKTIRKALQEKGFTREAEDFWVGPNGELLIESVVADIEEGRIAYVSGPERIALQPEHVLAKVMAQGGVG